MNKTDKAAKANKADKKNKEPKQHHIITNVELLDNYGYDPNDFVLFKNPDFNGAVIGVTSDGRAIYDYEKMIQAATQEEDWTVDEAIDWIEFNTIRSLSYINGSPVISYSFSDNAYDNDDNEDGSDTDGE